MFRGLNDLDRGAFVEAVGWVFEHSPWVAERTWDKRPFRDVESLHRAMVQQVEAASPEVQLTLLRAHPDLGTRAKISDASTTEQAGAGLTTWECELVESYRQKFGFPFIYAVKGSTKQDILKALEQRLPSTREDEFAGALQQVYRIAWFRLNQEN